MTRLTDHDRRPLAVAAALVTLIVCGTVVANVAGSDVLPTAVAGPQSSTVPPTVTSSSASTSTTTSTSVTSVPFVPRSSLVPGERTTFARPPGTTATTPTVPPGEDPIVPPGPLPPISDQPLNPAGDLAATCADPVVEPGQFRYFEQVMPGGSIGADRVQETWVPYDQDDEWLHRDTGWPGMPGGEWRAPRGEFFGPRGDSWDYPSAELLASAPRDPRLLYQRLVTDSVLADGASVIYLVRGLFQSGPVPAELLAATYRALGYHPYARVHQVTTGDGRPAAAITILLDFGGTENPAIDRVELLVDPADCQPLGWQIRTMTHGGALVTEHRVSHAVVDELGTRP